jgi:UDP-N-acetylglucosamine 2-epimerase (non-hydrolysing)
LRGPRVSAILSHQLRKVAQVPTPIRTAIVFGTRPEAIKLVPVIVALRADPAFAVRVIVTGQHRQMLDETLQPFGIAPDVDLDIMQPGQTLNQLVGRIVPRLDELYAHERPDVVLVQGDTTSAFCAALVAFHRRIAVGHVEAGLRSHDRFHPYPEEVNRRIISACADLHFAPTARAAACLAAEGTPDAAVLVTGNTGLDTLLMALEREPDSEGTSGGVLITLHRREAWAEPGVDGPTLMDDILTGVRRAAEAHPELDFVYPVHLNPSVRAPVARVLSNVPNVRLIEPLPYLPFVRLMSRARVIVSDSGGVQEEGPSLGVPVLVLRKTTERPEAIGLGMNQLVGTAPEDIAGAVRAALARPRARGPIPRPSPYGDGRAAARIRGALLHFFSCGPRPAAFVSQLGPGGGSIEPTSEIHGRG